MRSAILFVTLLIAASFALAGCGGAERPSAPDMESHSIFVVDLPACPVGVEASSQFFQLACGASATRCIDRASRTQNVCQCVCGKYWDCRRVSVTCEEGDGGAP